MTTKSQTDNTEWLDDLINQSFSEYSYMITVKDTQLANKCKVKAKQAVQAKLSEQDIKSRIDELYTLLDTKENRLNGYKGIRIISIKDRISQLKKEINMEQKTCDSCEVLCDGSDKECWNCGCKVFNVIDPQFAKLRSKA